MERGDVKRNAFSGGRKKSARPCGGNGGEAGKNLRQYTENVQDIFFHKIQLDNQLRGGVV